MGGSSSRYPASTYDPASVISSWECKLVGQTPVAGRGGELLCEAAVNEVRAQRLAKVVVRIVLTNDSVYAEMDKAQVFVAPFHLISFIALDRRLADYFTIIVNESATICYVFKNPKSASRIVSSIGQTMQQSIRSRPPSVGAANRASSSQLAAARGSRDGAPRHESQSRMVRSYSTRTPPVPCQPAEA